MNPPQMPPRRLRPMHPGAPAHHPGAAQVPPGAGQMPPPGQMPPAPGYQGQMVPPGYQGQMPGYPQHGQQPPPPPYGMVPGQVPPGAQLPHLLHRYEALAAEQPQQITPAQLFEQFGASAADESLRKGERALAARNAVMAQYVNILWERQTILAEIVVNVLRLRRQDLTETTQRLEEMAVAIIEGANGAQAGAQAADQGQADGAGDQAAAMRADADDGDAVPIPPPQQDPAAAQWRSVRKKQPQADKQGDKQA